jgi:uncharacterized membrane protein YgdD (TMEM256/DUF423 family)
MHRFFYRIAAFFAGLSVIIGAFGAHFLKTILSPESLNSIHTAVNYQMMHSLAILAVGLIYSHYHFQKILWAGYFFISGIVLFSGSIYLLAILTYFGVEFIPLIGLVTPLGGLSFIVGWLFLILFIPAKITSLNGSERGSKKV